EPWGRCREFLQFLHSGPFTDDKSGGSPSPTERKNHVLPDSPPPHSPSLSFDPDLDSGKVNKFPFPSNSSSTPCVPLARESSGSGAHLLPGVWLDTHPMMGLIMQDCPPQPPVFGLPSFFGWLTFDCKVMTVMLSADLLQDYLRVRPADLEEVMCEAQAAVAGPTNTRMSDVSGICAAPLCLAMQQNPELHTAVGPLRKASRSLGDS
ncbi:unnamed protein product, partial [Pleuronectes platessa]